MEKLRNVVYVVERYSSVSEWNVVECVAKNFQVAQEIMHTQIRHDIGRFTKSGYEYPVVSSSVDTDDESVVYRMNFKHTGARKGIKDIYVKYSISKFVVVPTSSSDWVTI